MYGTTTAAYKIIDILPSCVTVYFLIYIYFHTQRQYCFRYLKRNTCKELKKNRGIDNEYSETFSNIYPKSNEVYMLLLENGRGFDADLPLKDRSNDSRSLKLL